MLSYWCCIFFLNLIPHKNKRNPNHSLPVKHIVLLRYVSILYIFYTITKLLTTIKEVNATVTELSSTGTYIIRVLSTAVRANISGYLIPRSLKFYLSSTFLFQVKILNW